MPPFVTLDELKSRLAPLLERDEASAVVFDADGTLWSHDVGCMVYEAAVKRCFFREEARTALEDEAKKYGLEISGASATGAARSLLDGWYKRAYDERACAESQVWAYVGTPESEFRTFTRDALREGNHLSTLHQDVIALAEWVQAQGRRTCIVSASPLWVVQEAVADLCFDPAEVAAGIPNTLEQQGERVIQAGMKAPLPYGPDKVTAGRALLQGATWLAALGDSNFDLQMMEEAKLGVGIGDKKSMLDGLASMSHAVRLNLTNQ